ncbi:uncharacterized protein DS421_19g656630 [Arachis hypogaea]|uniref:Uncharacterized protein n=1 Tax=Arachis hypogaea TaxID=3818 RepID=A0A6B9V931_ARAHY|nr:uncharacterized protein DS421_19g656630 [Arachis hypogaea]
MLFFFVVMNKEQVHLSFVMLFLSPFIHLAASVPTIRVCCLLTSPKASLIHSLLHSIFKPHGIAYFYLTSLFEEFIKSWESRIHVVQMFSNIV